MKYAADVQVPCYDYADLAASSRANNNKTTTTSTDVRRVLGTVLTVLAILITACAAPAAPENVAAPQTPIATTTAAPTAAPAVTPTTADCRSTDYLLFVGLVDNSASMRAAAVARPTIDDLTPVLDHLTRCGGAIALGALTDRPTIFETCEVELPPTPPSVAEDGGDLITRAVHAAEADDALRRYNAAYAEWRAAATAKVDAFRVKAQPILEPDNLTLITDVNAGIRWTDAFFAQPRTAPVERRRLVVAAFTDGQHDADTEPVPMMKTKPEFLLINTSGSGDLPFPTIPTTSMQSAVSFALTPKGVAR